MEMDFTTCCIINAPLIVLNVTVNVFFMFCMICPLASGEEIKQPLKLLLWSLISATMSYLLSLIAALLSDYEHSFAPHVLTVYACGTCMTSSAWLNFFYCTQIIPAKQTLFVWIKKNVKSIIYCICICERLLSSFEMTIVLLRGFDMDESSNLTFSNTSSRLQGISTISFMILLAYFLLCLCVMVGSSGATVVYLYRHMRRMVTNGSPFFCPRFRSQARVTFTGVLQGVAHLFCSALIMGKWFNEAFGKDIIRNCPPYTFITIFLSCTTFTLGVGQAVFRKRIASVWLKTAQWRKTCNCVNMKDDSDSQSRGSGCW